MSADEQSQLQSKLDALQQKANQLFPKASFADASREVSEATTNIGKLPIELQRARSRGYVFAAYLEQKLTVLGEQWQTIQRDVPMAIRREQTHLRDEVEAVENALRTATQKASNLSSLQHASGLVENAVSTLEQKLKTAESSISAQYNAAKREIDQTADQLRQIHWMLDELDEASFKVLAGEKVFLIAEGEWVATGKGNQDPDGVLYLTDQRLLFEQKEKTGKKLGFFGGKHTQELKWEIPLHLVESVEPENKGLFGGKDMLHFTLKSGAAYPRITVEVKGRAKSKFWAGQIQRMIRGETKDERAIPPDPELLETLRNAPTDCPVCGASLPQLVAGQLQIDCRYCGTVIRI